MDQAIAHLNENPQEKIAVAARMHGVSRSALSRRWNEVSESASHKAISQQLLTPIQEQRLVRHIKELDTRGIPPTPAMICNFCKEITGIEPSKAWPARFVKRWASELSSGYLDRLEKQRFKADTMESYQAYFDLVDVKIKKHSVLPENMYNMDEKGFLIGWSTKQQRVFSKTTAKVKKYAINDANREWITLLATICADGSALPPGLIYAGKEGQLQSPWVDEVSKDTRAFFSASATGWTNDNIALAYMEKVFEPLTRLKAGRNKRLLLVDGHGSHVNLRFLEWCQSHSIIIACYPPHTTHRLQPLDVSLFSPLAVRYGQQLEAFHQRCLGLSSVKKQDFFSLFEPAFEQAFSAANIHSGFAKTGLNPLQPAVVLSTLPEPPKAPSSRPATSHSSDTSSSCTGVKKRVRFVHGLRDNERQKSGCRQHAYELQKVSNCMTSLAADVRLLKAQNAGLQQAVYMEQNKRKKGKTLTETVRAENECKALWFSPGGIQQMRDAAAAKEATKEAAKEAKAAARHAKRVQQEQEAIAKRNNALQQELQQRAKELEKESQKQRRIQRKELRQSSQQLQQETKAAAKGPRKRQPQAMDTSSSIPQQLPETSDQATSSRGRVLKPSRRLQR
jgi:hypothetical protein